MSRWRNIRCRVRYDGSRYLGWQKTTMGPSIEEAIENALEKILGVRPVLQAASRTDAGVHAEGQIINFLLSHSKDLKKLEYGINACLPLDIRIYALEIVDAQFHPTLDAVGKEYWYHVCNRNEQLPFFRHYSWHVIGALDLAAMQEAAAFLLGSHDFTAFCNDHRISSGGPVCTIFSINIALQEGARLRIVLRGNRFLYKMARNIAGTLVDVGRGRLSPFAIPVILQGKNRTLAGVTAPAHGLVLKNVFYDWTFENIRSD